MPNATRASWSSCGFTGALRSTSWRRCSRRAPPRCAATSTASPSAVCCGAFTAARSRTSCARFRAHQGPAEERLAAAVHGRLAAGDAVILEGQRVMPAVARRMAAEPMRLIIVTNQLEIAGTLLGKPGIDVILLGGKLHPAGYTLPTARGERSEITGCEQSLRRSGRACTTLRELRRRPLRTRTSNTNCCSMPCTKPWSRRRAGLTRVRSPHRPAR